MIEVPSALATCRFVCAVRDACPDLHGPRPGAAKSSSHQRDSALFFRVATFLAPLSREKSTRLRVTPTLPGRKKRPSGLAKKTRNPPDLIAYGALLSTLGQYAARARVAHARPAAPLTKISLKPPRPRCA